MKSLQHQHWACASFLDSKSFPANETCPSRCCAPLMPTAQGLLQGDIYLPQVRSYLIDSKVTLNHISRDLMLTTPRKSDGSKSLAWISENKAVNGINFENISAIGCLVQMHRNLWPDKYLFLWHLMFYIYKRSNLVEFQSKLAFISHSRLELSTGSKKVELLVRQIQGQVFFFNLSIDTNARVK